MNGYQILKYVNANIKRPCLGLDMHKGEICVLKNTIFILKDDLRKILRNPASLIVIGALCILPSLYAWFNIWASWDPYSNTEGIIVAVASEDEGVTVEGKDINVGDEVITSLSDNEDLGWRFMSKDKVIEGVEKGDYYAGIVIPKNFSEHLTSVLNKDIEKPILSYYINEKVNAISPKVTDKGATSIVDNIETSFLDEVNETILNIFNDIGLQLDENYVDIEKIRDGILELEDEMPYLYSKIEKIQDGIKLGQTGVDDVRDSLDKIDNLHDRLTSVNDHLVQRLDQSEEDAHDAINSITKSLTRAQDSFREVPNLTGKISGKGKDLDRLVTNLRDKQDDLDAASDRLQDVANFIDKQDNKLKESTKIKDIQSNLDERERELQSLKQDLDKVKKDLQNGKHPAVEVIDRLSDNIDKMTSNIDDLFTDYEEQIRPQLDQKIEDLSDVASDVDDFFDRASDRNNKALDKLQKLQDGIEKLKKEEIEDILNNLSTDIEMNLTRVNVIIPALTVAENITGSEKISDLNEKMKDIRKKLNKALVIVETAQKLNEKDGTISKKVIDQLEDSLGNIDEAINSAQGKWNDKTEEALDKANQVLQDLDDQITGRFDSLNELLSDLDSINDTLYDKAKNPEISIGILDKAINGIDKGTEKITSIDDGLGDIQDAINSLDISKELEGIHSMQDRLQDTKSSINHLITRIQESKEDGSDLIERVNRQANRIDNSLDDMIDFVNGDLTRKYDRVIDDAKTSLDQISTVFDNVDERLPKVLNVLDKIDDGLVEGKDKVDLLEEMYPEAKDAIDKAADKIRELEEEGNLEDLIDFLRNDPQRIRDFLSEPVELNEQKMYPVPNYGSAMNPFYTTLSMWVGGLLLVSSLRVDRLDKREFKSYQVYLARLAIFATIGVIQGFIVTLGNLLILGTYVVHKLEYVLFGMLIGLVFVSLVYTLVSVWGNVGKVLAIVFLVLQIGGSGGTFPIQMAPDFFQKIHGVLPFTHGIGLLRESVAGIIWSVAWTKIIYLILYLIIAIIIGIAFKTFFNRSSDKLASKAEESGFIL